MNELRNVLEYLPYSIQETIQKKINEKLENELNEIRLRTNKPLILKSAKEDLILEHIVKQEEVLKSFEKICENSVYSYKRQICDGYITIRGGNRVGIVGSAVVENGQVININYISSLNFRIAREKIGCSDNMIKQIINYETNSIYNTLIISPPGGGKTTLLRDIVRNLSNGFEDFKGKTIGVVDERGEIAAMYKGIPQNNVGIRTDVIDNMPKPEAMRILVRSMCPDIIACDEIGSKEDVDAIDYVMCSGVKGIFTAHGGSIEEIKKNPELSKLFNKNVFERIILSQGRSLATNLTFNAAVFFVTKEEFMEILRYILLIIIFSLSTAIGLMLSKMYENRVIELKEFKNILNFIKTKIKFTYEPLAEIFKQIAESQATKTSIIFDKMVEQIKYKQAKVVWENCIQEADISINQEDKDVLKKLGKLLGQTDVEGQISEIEVTENFLDMQIEKAEEERKKNQKLYKTLGIVTGLVLVIILL